MKGLGKEMWEVEERRKEKSFKERDLHHERISILMGGNSRLPDGLGLNK